MNILIIEDNFSLAENIKKAFLSYKFYNRIDILSSYKEYLHQDISILSYDIVLLDINLSISNKKRGLDILKHIRNNNNKIPIIMISGICDYCCIERAFQLGAHDYINKPFRNRELQIRIERWFRSYVCAEYFSITNEIIYSGITYNLKKYEFYIKSKKIVLSRGSKYLFSLFFIHKDELLKQEFLAEKIWGNQKYDNFSALRIKIMRLKNQLKLFNLDQSIFTVRGEGYMFKIDKT